MIPLRPVSGSQTHADAITRLSHALGERQRRRQHSQDVDSNSERMTAAVDLAAADEQVAAREAWVYYLEQSQ